MCRRPVEFGLHAGLVHVEGQASTANLVESFLIVRFDYQGSPFAGVLMTDSASLT